MKKLLNLLGIYTINDLACTIGGFLICVLAAEIVFFAVAYVFEIKEYYRLDLAFPVLLITAFLICICGIVDVNTK